MSKIPVFRSVARAYGFAFGHFGTALTVAWLPYALIVLAGFFLLVPAAQSCLHGFADAFGQINAEMTDVKQEQVATDIVNQLFGLYRPVVVFFLLYIFLRAVAAIGLTRASMGLDQDNRFFYFSAGAPVWKLFGSWLATFLIIYALQTVLVIAFVFLTVVMALLGAALVKIGPDFLFASALLVYLAIYLAVLCIVAYVSIRLNFFLPPIVISEKKLDLLRSWELSKGNVWRIVGIYLLIAPPYLVFAFACWAIVALALLPHVSIMPFNVSPMAETVMSDIVQAAELSRPWIAPLMALAFLAQILFSALLFAATARAYRGLVATDIANQTAD